MRKLFALLLALVMVVSLSACGSGDDNKTPSSDNKTPSNSQQQEQNIPDTNEGEDKPEETPAEKPALPILRDKKKANGWTQYDYQWPGRYGFDYMVKIAQWLIWDGLEPKTLTTGSLGGKETEHIEAWQEKRYVEKSVGPEAGYLGIGGFHRYVPAPVKVYFYNQTNVVRFFVAGDGHDKGVNDLAERIAQAKLK